jgi:predicted nucleic acid-binding protein
MMFAVKLGLRRMGTLAVLALAKKSGLVPEIRPLIEELRANEIYLGDAVVEAVLKESGE